jgi:hypothetical protein
MLVNGLMINACAPQWAGGTCVGPVGGLQTFHQDGLSPLKAAAVFENRHVSLSQKCTRC